ncbi:carbohydrate kinase family protein [bacterium]|nr:carbohydrate kinase family protein [bacterium]
MDLVSLGETFEDIIFHDLKSWPELGREQRCSRLVRTWGGGALLTAVAAARQGRSVQVVSGLAAAAQSFLKRENIKVRNLRRGGEAHAITVGLSTTEDRAFVTYPGVNDQLEERFLAALPTLRGRHLHLALEPRDCKAWKSALDPVRARGLTISWDFGWNEELVKRPGFHQLLDTIDFLFLNENEAILYSGGRDWSRRSGTTIIKLGKNGCQAWQGGRKLEVPGLKVQAVDSTGAGDAFNGGFLAAMLDSQDLRASLQLGNRIGAASTLCAGGLEGLPRA